MASDSMVGTKASRSVACACMLVGCMLLSLPSDVTVCATYTVANSSETAHSTAVYAAPCCGDTSLKVVLWTNATTETQPAAAIAALIQ